MILDINGTDNCLQHARSAYDKSIQEQNQRGISIGKFKCLFIFFIEIEFLKIYQCRFVWRHLIALCAFDRFAQMNGFNMFLEPIFIDKRCTAYVTLWSRTGILDKIHTCILLISLRNILKLWILTIWLPEPASDRWTVWMWFRTLVREINRFPQNSHISPDFGSFLWTNRIWFSSDFVDVYLPAELNEKKKITNRISILQIFCGILQPNHYRFSHCGHASDFLIDRSCTFMCNFK